MDMAETAGKDSMGSYTVTLLVLALLSVPFITCEDFVWRTKGHIIKVEPLCGATIADDSIIKVYADLPVVVQIFCKNDVIVTPNTQDGVQHSQVVAANPASGEQCLFEKTENTQVYTVKVQVGWEYEGAAVNEARELFLIDCSYGNKASSITNQERIDVSKHLFEEVIHNMGPTLENTAVSLQVVDIQGTSLSHIEVTLGRIIKLEAFVTGPVRVRPVNCIATNGVKVYRLFLGGCGDGMVFHKTSGFTVNGARMNSPYFVAFRLQGPAFLIFKCNFTACLDTETCDGSSCYHNNRAKRSLTSHESELSLTEAHTSDHDLAGVIESSSSSPPPQSQRHSRRSVCRLDPTDPELTTSARPRCIDKREDTGR